MEPTSSQEELARLWTLAQPSLAAFVASMLPDYHDAQDVLQEVAVVLLRKFDEYDRRRTFFAWAAGIARNEVLAWRRRNAASAACIVLDESALDQVAQAFDRWGDGLGEFGDAMERCLQQLKGKSLALIKLRYREGMSSTEIGARTDSTPGSVDVALHRIRESIRNCIERRLGGLGKGRSMIESHALISAYLDQALSSEQARDLSAWVAEHPSHAMVFAQFAALHRRLQERFAAEAMIQNLDGEIAAPGGRVKPRLSARQPQSAASPRGIARYPHVPFWPAMAAAVMLMVASLTLIVVRERSGTSQATVALPVIATTLANATGAQWDAPYDGLQPGAALPTAPLFLKKGLAEIRCGNGVTMVVEGPARLTVRTADEVELNRGKIVAVVPANARGFSIQTPSGRVVDLGTEFGVEVSDDQATRLEVFRGSLRAEAMGTDGKPITQTLVADQAALIAGGRAGIQPAPRAPLRFVRPDQIAFTANAAYERWRTFSDALRKDSSLIAYYTFDNAREAPDLLFNRSAAGRELDGILGGGDLGACPTWTTGRWEQKGALEFSSNSAQRVTLDGLSDALNFSRGTETARPFTIAAWVKGDANRAEESIICRGEEWKEQFALDVKGGGFRAWVRDKPTNTQEHGAEARSNVLPDGSWQHVVEIYDPSQGFISLYVNGQFVAGKSAPKMLLASADVPVIGCRQWSNGRRLPAFAGKIDELAIFNRPVSAEEVRRLYQVGLGSF